MSTNFILTLIRETILSVIPTAKIILFGSRARGNARPDSDWDVLVLLDAPTITPQHAEIDYILWQKGLEYNQEINTVLRTQQQWDQTTSLFKHNITKEGIRI